MVYCKKCGSDNTVKDGLVRGQQRYLCKQCKYRFLLADRRTNGKIAVIKALFTLVIAQRDVSFTELSKMFGRDRSLLYRWYVESGRSGYYPPWRDTVMSDFEDMEELIEREMNYFNKSAPMFVLSENLSNDEFSAVVIIQRNTDLSLGKNYTKSGYCVFNALNCLLHEQESISYTEAKRLIKNSTDKFDRTKPIFFSWGELLKGEYTAVEILQRQVNSQDISSMD